MNCFKSVLESLKSYFSQFELAKWIIPVKLAGELIICDRCIPFVSIDFSNSDNVLHFDEFIESVQHRFIVFRGHFL